MTRTIFLLCAMLAGLLVWADEVTRFDPRMADAAAVVDTNGVKWIDGRLLPLEGKAFADTATYYERMPTGVTERVNGGVRSMKVHTAGLQFRFRTDSRHVRFQWRNDRTERMMPNMARSGHSSIDVYRRGADGRWRFVKTGCFRDMKKGGDLALDWTPGEDCLVNLPLYNGIAFFRLGIDRTASVSALPPRTSGVTKPVVFYGTSITQGATASRPGMSFVNIVGRELDVPVVNLGFSGSGKMELEMADWLARIDASCYVLDCLWNMGAAEDTPDCTDIADKGDPQGMLHTRFEPFVRKLHAARPDVPIVLAERCDAYGRGPCAQDVFIRGVYERLKAEGSAWKNLSYLPKTDMLPADGEGAADGTHPNDWGMKSMAAAFGKAVKAALGLDARDSWARYVPAFNRTDEELYTNAIPNSAAEEFLRANAPSFECPDKELERTYHFRWWTYRKHLKKTAADGWVVSEFLPPVGWAGPEGTINCASGHHVREGRWLADKSIVHDYLKFMLVRGRTCERGAYAWWPATSLGDWLDVTGETEKALALLPLLKENFSAWERGWNYGDWFWIGKDAERVLFAITDGYEGTEMSLTGAGYRPLVNAAMYGEAKALERFCSLAKDGAGTAFYRTRAAALEESVKRQLWDSDRGFFLTMRLDGARTPVRELHGYAPWYFGMPLDRSYDCAFGWLTREDGFLAPKGLTFPERSAKGFVLAYEGHECQWNGPSWPLATSVALTALGRHLQSGGKGDAAGAFYRLLHQYAEQHRRTREDGTVVPWIDENVNPLTGDWMSRTIILRTPWMRERFFRERGKDYNHSTFCDLVISGLVGFIPHPDGTYDLKPLAPKDWDSFSLHNVRHCGRILDIDYSRARGFVVTERQSKQERRID